MDPTGNIDMLTTVLFTIIGVLVILTAVIAVRRDRFKLPAHSQPGTVTLETERWARLCLASLEDAEDDLGRFRQRILAQRAGRSDCAA